MTGAQGAAGPGGLDHVGLVVADLDRAAAAFEALGFALTPLSMHSGALSPGGPVVALGTGNRCAMLGTGYIELISPIDRARPCGVYPGFLERYEGIHVLAFATAEPEALAEALRRRGVPLDGLYPLRRRLEGPDGPAEARFTILRLAPDHMPEGRIIAVRHETPELLWQPGTTRQPNGAHALSFVAITVADLGADSARYRDLLGVEPVVGAGSAAFTLPQGRLLLVTEAHARQVFGASPPSLPHVTAFGVTVDDPEKLARRYRVAGIPHRKDGNHLIVPPGAACGAACIFEPADRRSAQVKSWGLTGYRR